DRRSHLLRGRVGDDQVGMLLLERAQLPHEVVVLGVADSRRVENVIAMVGLTDLFPEFGDARLEVGHQSSRIYWSPDVAGTHFDPFRSVQQAAERAPGPIGLDP